MSVRVFELGLRPDQVARRGETLEPVAASCYSDGQVGVLCEVHAPEVGFQSDRDDARGGRASE